VTQQPAAFAVFHLNLAFSSIPESARRDVVERCYHPLLDLVEHGYPLGIELTGWTAERIAELDPGWVSRFAGLLEAGRCELVGSGHAQIIGPLAPGTVDRWNQRIGTSTYERLFGRRPAVALINEMAFSSSLVDLYADSGYRALVMDRDNVRLALGIEDQPVDAVPTHAEGPSGARLPILWADSILFQKLQQVAHRDISETDYRAHLAGRLERGEDLLPLYANDAEVFDFRPGRFEGEATLSGGEWDRVRHLLDGITTDFGLEWRLPSEVSEAISEKGSFRLTSASYPIPVKKQAKYNLARWAASGRNDVWANTMSHRATVAADGSDEDVWRRVCEAWSTDLRTHVTPDRWAAAEADIEALLQDLGATAAFGGGDEPVGADVPPPDSGVDVVMDDDGIRMSVTTDAVQMVLNRRRGITIQQLGFESHGAPTVGTLSHGYFRSIALGADFYSGGVVGELHDEHRRITDLDRVVPTFRSVDGGLEIHARIDTVRGPLIKMLTIPAAGEWIELGYRFPDWTRWRGSLRAGTVTLLPDGFGDALRFGCRNGGDDVEWFDLDRPVDHAAATSALISSTAGLGASDGRIVIGDGERDLLLSWDPAQCAVFPMIRHIPAEPGALTRVFFSLLELDDTTVPGGPIGTFWLRIAPFE